MSILIHNATLVLPARMFAGATETGAADETPSVIPRGWLLIEGERIVQAGEGSPPHPLTPSPDQTIDATHKVVLPGFTNAHTHLEQTFMRGYSANKSLLHWLKNYIWKLQGAMDADDVRLATTLGMVEAMRGGATTIIDHHKVPFTKQHTDVVLQAAEQIGVRLVLARAWADRGTNAESPDAIFGDLQRLFAEWHGAANGRIHIANGPLVPWRCSAETLQRATELARKHDAITHCHVNETQDEVAMTLKDAGMRPIEWFDSLGLIDDHFHAVHGVWLSDGEIKILKKRNAQVTHCPAANMILASGVAPITRLLRDGVRVALATDGPASNDGQDMFEMMRLAAYLQRVHTMDAQAMPPMQVIEMAMGPRPTLPRHPSAGSGGEGQGGGDLILVDMNAAHIQPVGEVAASLVYNARGSDVDTLIVAGRILIQDKKVLGLDEAALLDECRDRAKHLAKRAGVEIGNQLLVTGNG
jgi:5-methylthioadenosine/S-adenosylhomocysteine deaminase